MRYAASVQQAVERRCDETMLAFLSREERDLAEERTGSRTRRAAVSARLFLLDPGRCLAMREAVQAEMKGKVIGPRYAMI
jgi:hypothetical protein